MRRSRNRMSTGSLHVMLIPGALAALIFSYLPLLGSVMAFQDFLPALYYEQGQK